MKVFFSTIIALFIFLHQVSDSQAATYYLSTSGNDSNIGSIDKPLKSFSKVDTLLKPGDIVYFRGGTYPSFTVNKSGISGSPILISKYQDEIVNVTGGVGIKLNNVNYVNIDGFDVSNASGAGVPRLAGILIYGGGNNTIQNSKSHHNNIDSPNGIKIDSSSNNKILRNEVYNNGGSSGGVGIRIIGTFGNIKSTNNEVGWNTVYNNTAAGSNADGIGQLENVSESYIHDNIVYANGDDGIDTWNTSNNLIINNTVYQHIGPGDGNGFKLGGYTKETNGTNHFGGGNTIKNNRAYDNKYNGFDSNGSGANYYESNISYNNGKWGFQDSWRTTGDTRPSSLINNNSFANSDSNYIIGQYTSIFTNNTESSQSPTPTSMTKNGDANNDNRIDNDDFYIWASYLGQLVYGVEYADFNLDNQTDGIDYVIWALNYGY